MKKAVLIVLIIALAAGAAWIRLEKRGGSGNGRVALYGNIDIRQVRLGFRVGGKVLEALVDEGDAVGPGVVVARLDDEPYRHDLALARARRDAAAAVREKAVNGPRRGEIDQARAHAEELKANLDMAELTFRRYRTLVETNAISREAFDQAEAARDAARERLRAGAEALDLLLEGTRKEEIAAAEAELRAAEALLASAETALADTVLAAPAKGVVISRVTEPGTIVAAGETAMVVSLDQPVWARAFVAEALLGLVHPGKEVEIFTDSRPDAPYAGRIGFISPVAEFTPKSVETPELRTSLVYRIRVVVDQPDSGLRQGMPVTITFADARE